MATYTLVKKLLSVVVVIGALLCAGCLGSPTQPAAKTFIGVVADGYLQGVIVFLDKNGNRNLDAGEPCAVTDASGTYVISDVTLADLLRYPIVVRVLATAIDRGTGQTVGKEYYLSSPPGKPGFVSPMTTLVHSLMQANPALDVDAAEAAIKAQIGVSVSSLFGDYLRDASTRSVTAKESQLIHNVARVVVAAVVTDMASITASLGGMIAPADLGAVIAIVNQNVTRQLAYIASQVPVTTMTTDAVARVAASLSRVDATTIRRQIDARAAVAVGSYRTSVQGSGYSRLDKAWASGQYPYRYDRFLLGAETSPGEYSLDETDFQGAGGTWLPLPAGASGYELADGGWVPVPGGPPEGAVRFNSDGTATFTRSATGRSQTIAVSTIDVTGREVAPYAAQCDVDVASSVQFPPGSYAYEMTTTRLQDNYWLNGDSDLQAPGVDWLLSAYGTASGKYLDVWDGTAVQFAGSGSTGTVKFFIGQKLQTQTGSWELRSVAGEQVLLIASPFAYKTLSADLTTGDDRIYGMAGGAVREGRIEYANAPRLQWGYMFNKTAMDAILQNFIP